MGAIDLVGLARPVGAAVRRIVAGIDDGARCRARAPHQFIKLAQSPIARSDGSEDRHRESRPQRGARDEHEVRVMPEDPIRHRDVTR
jgi:hypothetical protein